MGRERRQGAGPRTWDEEVTPPGRVIGVEVSVRAIRNGVVPRLRTNRDHDFIIVFLMGLPHRIRCQRSPSVLSILSEVRLATTAYGPSRPCGWRGLGRRSADNMKVWLDNH